METTTATAALAIEIPKRARLYARERFESVRKSFMATNHAADVAADRARAQVLRDAASEDAYGFPSALVHRAGIKGEAREALVAIWRTVLTDEAAKLGV